jgi:hypothetical protein
MLLRTYSLVAAVLALPTAAIAQEDPLSFTGHVSLSAGVSIYERSGFGTTGAYALRVDVPVYPNVVLEGGLSYARREDDSIIGDVFIPGLQVQIQGVLGPVSPYAGLGAGITVERRGGGAGDDLSFAPSVSTGVRAQISDGIGVRVDGRLHGVGANVRGLYSEITAGLSVSW